MTPSCSASNPPNRNANSRSNLEWLARSFGFVDKVCCYSYAKDQIYDEAIDLRTSSSYESVWLEQRDPSIVSKKRRSSRDQESSHHKGHITLKPYEVTTSFPNSPGRSMDTATTVTTSTCTTIPTSVKHCPSYNEECEWQQQPYEISFPRMNSLLLDNAPPKLRPVQSSASIRYYAATEGFEG